MWEMIQSNRRKSAALIVLMAAVLMALGYFIGFTWQPDGGGVMGVLIAMVVWGVMMAVSYGGGEKILLATAGAREVRHTDAPQLFNIVEEMKIASGLPKMPRVFIMDTPVPNAFAVGLKPERAAVAVTTGLLARLSRDELQGVVAHELGHINNRDTMFMTLAGVTVGAVIILSDLFLRGLWYGGGRRRSSRQEGQLAVVMMIVAIVLAILAPLLAQLLYFACSRRREYLADASAAQYTRYPEGLASALEKISAADAKPREVSRALAPMYTVNPLAARSGVSGLFSTHPPTEDRIRVLRGMSGDSSLAAYEQAFRAAHRSGIVGAHTLQASQAQPARAAAGEASEVHRQWRDARDILHRADGYLLLACPCGMKMKLPPEFDRQKVACPRCGAEHAVPPELLAAAAGLDAAAYRR